jgi:hypothetical protein
VEQHYSPTFQIVLGTIVLLVVHCQGNHGLGTWKGRNERQDVERPLDQKYFLSCKIINIHSQMK